MAARLAARPPQQKQAVIRCIAKGPGDSSSWRRGIRIAAGAVGQGEGEWHDTADRKKNIAGRGPGFGAWRGTGMGTGRFGPDRRDTAARPAAAEESQNDK